MKKFTITEQHLKLIKEMWLNKTSLNTPQVDLLRPYGNSDVLGDVAHILGVKSDRPDGGFYLQQVEQLETLHSECTTALQICMGLLKFEIGTYQQMEQCDSRGWEKID